MPKSVNAKKVVTKRVAPAAPVKKAAAVKRVAAKPEPLTIDTPGALVRVTTLYRVKRSPAGATTPNLIAVEDESGNRVLTVGRSELELVGDGR